MHVRVIGIQCVQIGQFYKDLGHIRIRYKSSRNNDHFLGYLRQHNNVRKNLFGYFCEQLLKTIGLLFIPSSDHTAHTNIQLNLD